MLEKYRKEIADEMVARYRIVLECHGRLQYKIYCWEDGEIECLEQVQGDNSWLQPRDAEPRELYYIDTVKCPCFDPWDVADHPAPEDDDAREAEEKEIIDYCVDEYKANIDDVLDEILKGVAENEEG